MKTLKELFPRSSNSFLKANEKALTEIAAVIRAADKTFTPDKPKITRRGIMNKTEREFSFILEAQKRNNEILSYHYEGITLRWPVGGELLTYTPDFAVFGWVKAGGYDNGMKLIEIKGAFTKGKFERAVERFRHARTYWPQFTFELHQKAQGRWSQIA